MHVNPANRHVCEASMHVRPATEPHVRECPSLHAAGHPPQGTPQKPSLLAVRALVGMMHGATPKYSLRVTHGVPPKASWDPT
jgi:hypothetical protein